MTDRHAANLAKVKRLRALVGNAWELPWTHHEIRLNVAGDPEAALIFAAVNALPAVVVDVEGRLAVHTRREHALPGASGHVCTRCRDPWPCDDYRAAERVLDALKEA